MRRWWVGGLAVLGCSPSVTQVDGSGSSDSETTATPDDSSTSLVPTSTTVDPTIADASSSETTLVSTESSGSTSDETNDDTSESTGEPAASCGDGMLDPNEGCDDGNRDDADACDSDCVPTEAIVWTAEYGGRDDQGDCASRVVATADGVWVAGKLRDEDLDSDGWVGRLDDDGEWLWHARYNGSGGDDDEATGLAVDEAGHAFATGSYTHNGQHLWLQRLDGDGVEVWSSTWSDALEGPELPSDVVLVDGAPWISVRRIDLDAVVQQWSSDGVLVASVPVVPDEGFELRPFDLGVGPTGAWLFASEGEPQGFDEFPTLLRLGSDASVQQSIDVATATEGFARPLAGTVGPDGSLAVVSYDTPAGGETPTVRLWDPTGTLLDAWLVEIDDEPRANAIALTNEGDVILAGERDNVPWVRRIDIAGEGMWDRLHSPPDGYGAVEALSIAPDGDIVVAGCTGLGATSDVWVRRYRP